MKTLRLAMLAACLLAVGCGGDDGGPAAPRNNGGGGGNINNTFTANIDGSNWVSAGVSLTGDQTPTRQGRLSISGYNASGKRGIALSFSFLDHVPMTLPLGVDYQTNAGGTAAVYTDEAFKSWSTPGDGKAGYVSVTVRTDKRIAGTFQFYADGFLGGGTPTNVTNGQFDITVESGLPPLPTGVPSTGKATIDGNTWIGARIEGTRSGPGQFSVQLSNNVYIMTVTAGTPITTTGEHDIGSEITLRVQEIYGGSEWSTGSAADLGTFNISSLEADRVTGSFYATLPKQGGGDPLTITGGLMNAYLASE